MAYRFSGTDPVLRASIGAFNGYALRNGAGGGISEAALLKRNAASAWHGITTIDNGTATGHWWDMEFNPSNQMVAAHTGSNWPSTATFNNTTDFMIVGFTWNGAAALGDWIWRWKIGAGSWTSENEDPATDAAAPTTLGSGFRHVIGNEPGLADDASYDMVCIGKIKGVLSQATFESLDMVSFASWEAVFTGADAWLLGFEDIGTQTDRTGNGGDELSRSGVSLVADPAGWAWGVADATMRGGSPGMYGDLIVEEWF